MKVAIPENVGTVNQHFGKSNSFAIIDIDDNKNIIDVEIVPAAGLQHQHEGIAQFLKDKGVETVIVGGIGPGAIQKLEDNGINILFGAAGPVKEVAETFAKGQFVSERKICNHHGNHHGNHHHHH